MRHSLTLNVTGGQPHWRLQRSLRHLSQKALQGAYRRHIFEENVAFRLDALAGALAVFTVPDELDRKRNIFFLRPGDQLLQSHPFQDAARQPSAQKPSFPSYYRGPALNRLHRGVEAREADGIQEDIGAIEQSIKSRAVQPGNEDHMLTDIQAVAGENGFESPLQFFRQIAHFGYEENELAPAQPAGDFGNHPIVLRCVFEWHAGAQKKRRLRVDAQFAQVGTDRLSSPGPIETTQIGQGNQPFRVILLRLGWLHFFRGQVVIDRRQPGRLGMPPRRHLDRRKAQAGELYRHRVHPDLRIDEHVQLLVDDALHPTLQRPGSVLEARCGRLCKQGLLVLTNAEIERVEREALAADFLEPALDDGVPDRVVPKVLRGDPDADHAVGGASSGNDEALPPEPLAHQPRAKVSVALEQTAVVFFLIRQRKRLLGAHRPETLRAPGPVKPALQVIELRSERGSAARRIGVRPIDLGYLRYRKRPSRFDVLGIEQERLLVAVEPLAQSALVPENVTQAIMRFGEVRPKREDLFVAGNRFIQPVLIPQDVREVVVRLEQVGLDHERLPVAGNCLVRLALDIEHVAQVDICRREIRSQRQGFFVTGDSFIPSGLVLVGISLTEVPFAGFGLKRRRFVIVDGGFASIAPIPEDILQPGARRRSIGCKSESPLVAGEGAIRLALGPEGGTQIDECVYVIRIERQSVQVRDDGLVELSSRYQRIAEIVVRGRIRRIALERPRYQLGGPSMFAPLMGDDAQEVQRIDVLRIDCQHFSVGRLRLTQTPCLMVLQGSVELA